MINGIPLFPLAPLTVLTYFLQIISCISSLLLAQSQHFPCLIQSSAPAEPPGPLPLRRASVFHPDFSSLFLDPNAVMPEQLTTSRPSKDSGSAGNVATQSPHHRFPPVGEVPGKPGKVLHRDHPQPGTGEAAAGL